jgi:phosphatidylglycerol---prolipoprotein diacylglyceryl transferase
MAVDAHGWRSLGWPPGKPDWLPTWLWTQTYDNNIYGRVIPPPGVYPAPIYETAMALALLGLLWVLRSHSFRTGWLFALYLVLAGAERLLIEQIRVNPTLHVLGMQITQAEMIAMLFIVLGLAGLIVCSRPSSVGSDMAVTGPVPRR